MATVAGGDTTWRDAMTREDRIKVCQHIMQKLATYYQMVPEQALREKTSAFESQAYTHAESRTDYLRRIAGGLSNVERQVTQNAAATAPKRTRSSSSSIATGPQPGRKNTTTTSAAKPQPPPADVTPDMLLAFQQSQSQSSQQSRFAMQQAQARAVAQRQQHLQQQNLGPNPNPTVTGLGMPGTLPQRNPNPTNPPNGRPQPNVAAAAAAAAAGVNVSPYMPLGDRKLTTDQINQLVNTGMLPGMPPGASTGMSLAQAQAQQGAHRNVRGSRALNAAALLQQQIQLQQQGMSVPAVRGYDARTQAAAQAAAMRQMGAMGQSGTAPPAPGTSADAYAYNRMKATGGTGTNHQVPPGTGPPGGGGGGAAGAGTGGVPGVYGADSEEFWEKLQEMKKKYNVPLSRMCNFMQIIANSQRPEKKEQFRKHLKDCFQILGLKRGQKVHGSLTTAVLETASKFIDSVINVYKNYVVNERNVKRMTQAQPDASVGGAGPAVGGTPNTTTPGDGGATTSQISRMSSQVQQQQQQQQQQQFAAMHGGMPGMTPETGTPGQSTGQQEMFRHLQQQYGTQHAASPHAGAGIGAVGAPVSDAAKAAAAKVAAGRMQQQNLNAQQMARNAEAQKRMMAMQEAKSHQQRMAQQAAAAAAAAAVKVPSKAPTATLEQRVAQMQAAVKVTCDRTLKWEQFVDSELKRGKAERIQNTLAALRNVNSVRPGKRSSSLVDVENFADRQVIAKSVFECSAEQGLRLAKRPKNDEAELRALREAVEADCNAAKMRNKICDIEIEEEYGQPVVYCTLLIPEIKLPRLILRVQRGYPRKGGATYGFERPPLGWVGVLGKIKERFKRALANAPATSVGVAALLDAWAREAEEVVEMEIRAESEDEEIEGVKSGKLTVLVGSA